MLRLAVRPIVFTGLLCAVFITGLMSSGESEAGIPPKTFIVDTLAPDPQGAFFTCDLPNVNVDCSLVGAMSAANLRASLGPDIINFDFGALTPPFVITPTAALPDITDAVVIDGSACITVPGSSPCVRIDGVNVPGHAGLKTTGTTDNVTIRGLSIYNVTNWSGIEINGENSLVEQTFLGTPNGVTVAPNGSGINVLGNNNTIGSSVPGKHNLVSGNNSDGIGIYGNGNTVIGNWTGVGFSGTTSMANDLTGIYVYGSNNTIGGLAQGEGNTASGNTGGVFPGGVGIALVGQGNTAVGNLVGTDPTGTFGIANGTGIVVLGNENAVGGADPQARNIISGNTSGLLISGDDSATSGVQVHGNWIGLNADGTALPNLGTGVQLTSGGVDALLTNVTIGGLRDGEGNVISGNIGNGIVIDGANTVGNTIAGNFIGTHPTGIVTRANGGVGIAMSSGATGEVANNTISSNLISGNGLEGMHLSGAGTHSNIIDSNKIGTDVTGAGLLQNAADALEIEEGAHDNLVLLNVITSGATNIGVSIGDVGANAPNNSLFGNYIGTNENGDVLGAGQLGVIVDSSTGTTIGSDITPASLNGAGPQGVASGNVIANAVSDGILVRGANATGNRISGNSIYNNGGLGINLELDANDDQDPPRLDAATSGSTSVVGTLTSTANEAYRVQLFASPVCDPSGRGEGKDFLGAFSVLTDETGIAQVSHTVTGTAPVGSVVTATATDDDDNTSQFSNCVIVTAGPTPSPSPTPSGPVGDADCDNDVDMDDAIGALSEAANVEPGALCPDRADADCDDDVDADDALRIVLHVAGTPRPPATGCGTLG